MSARTALYSCLVIAASARTLLHIAAMPPYAGLDEIQHVAHLAFAAQEGRSPTTREASVPPYLDNSLHQVYGAVPSFAHVGERWPQVVRENNRRIIQERVLGPADLRPYKEPNYEAQQTRLYYSLAAPLLRLIDIRTAEAELRLWRLVAAALAVVIVVATAAAGEALFGLAAIPAAAVLLVLPTWFALVLRVANDALACALVACAFALTACLDPSPRRAGRRCREAADEGSAPHPAFGHPLSARRGEGLWLLEGLLWAAALATKLYTWPLLIVVPILWRRQRASRPRIAVVSALCIIALALTMSDLHSRTSNALGSFNYERADTASAGTSVDWGEIVRVTIATAAWTSGQHWDALTPLAIALYLGPIAILIATFLMQKRPPEISVAAAVLAAFAAAQAFNIVRCIMAGRYSIPIGKEGWYWYVAAPVVIAIVLPSMLQERPKIFVAAFCWLAAWDIVIHEVALFHDYAGATSPASPTALFRWGPLFLPFTADLRGIAVGPGERFLTAFRVISLIASAAAFSIYLRAARRSAPHSSGTT